MQGQAFRVFLKNIYIYIYKYKIALRVLKLVNGLIVVGFAFIDLSKKKKKIESRKHNAIQVKDLVMKKLFKSNTPDFVGGKKK